MEEYTNKRGRDETETGDQMKLIYISYFEFLFSFFASNRGNLHLFGGNRF